MFYLKPLENDTLTEAQNELYGWIRDYLKNFQHSPSIRQMMKAMGLKSPAPIQSRLKHLQEKGYISWQEGKARTLQIVEDVLSDGIPILGSIAAGGLIETFDDVQEELDITSVINKKGLYALIVNGDSMIDACIADGDTVLLEPVDKNSNIREGTIVSAYIPGSGATLKYFFKKENKISLEAANPNYLPIILEKDQVSIQGRLCAVWRKT